MYHGNKAQREEILRKKIMNHLKSGRPTEKFPVVCTSYEMVLNDHHNLSRIKWEFIIIVSIPSLLMSWDCLLTPLCRMRVIV